MIPPSPADKKATPEQRALKKQAQQGVNLMEELKKNKAFGKRRTESEKEGEGKGKTKGKAMKKYNLNEILRRLK